MSIAPQSISAIDGFYKVLAKIHEIVSHPDRLKILNAVSARPRTYSEIASIINANPRMISWHLSVLKNYGFINKKGKDYMITDLGRLLIHDTINSMVQVVERTLESVRFT